MAVNICDSLSLIFTHFPANNFLDISYNIPLVDWKPLS